MRNEFTAIIEWGEDWYVAFCPEMPAASGQGITRQEARDNLAEAILLVLEDSRDDGLRGVPNEAIREVIVVPVRRNALLHHLRRHHCRLKAGRPVPFNLAQPGHRRGSIHT